ncbi:MAG: FkbM family methyltransferase [Candidatus Aminicenantes bacterium]
MSAETDFAYLKSCLFRPEDSAKLDEIAETRRCIRFEGRVFTDTRFIDIQFGELLFMLRRDLAPASLDTYIEIFRDQAHMKIPEFQPEHCSSVIDAGANEGFYSLHMKSRNPDIPIISVEPSPEIFDILTRNIRVNKFSGIHAVNFALSDRSGPGALETYPHVSSVSSENILQLNRSWIKPERIRTTAVHMATLPALLKDLNWEDADLLKIDTEGSEMKILKGSEPVLERIRKIVVEWHTPELREKCTRFLLDRNFQLVHEERRRTGDSYFINID